MDANLSVLIGGLRRALQDPADAPRFIRTIRGFGDAFGASVAEQTITAGPRFWGRGEGP